MVAVLFCPVVVFYLADHRKFYNGTPLIPLQFQSLLTAEGPAGEHWLWKLHIHILHASKQKITRNTNKKMFMYIIHIPYHLF